MVKTDYRLTHVLCVCVSNIGVCAQVETAIAKLVKKPNGYRMPLNGCAAMGVGGLQNSFLRCHCQIAMANGPTGYRMAPKGCAAMGVGGLPNSISEVPLPNCNGQWAQWGIGWCPHLG